MFYRVNNLDKQKGLRLIGSFKPRASWRPPSPKRASNVAGPLFVVLFFLPDRPQRGRARFEVGAPRQGEVLSGRSPP
eukprot:6564869-Pyramimonas_sp.AAC.1